MDEQSKLTFLEKLTLTYPGQFTVEKKAGVVQHDAVVFAAKNKRFGDIKISGDLHQWEDEDDYDDIKYDEDNYLEGGGDFQDYREDISLYFETKAFFLYLTPSEIFEYLEAIFNDQLLFIAPGNPGGKGTIIFIKEMNLKKNCIREEYVCQKITGSVSGPVITICKK